MKIYNFFELGILYSRYYAAKSDKKISTDDILDEYNGLVKKLNQLELGNIKSHVAKSEEPFDFIDYFENNGMKKEGKSFRMGQLSFAIFLIAPIKNTKAENEIVDICEYLKFNYQCFNTYFKEIDDEKISAFRKLVANVEREFEIIEDNQKHISKNQIHGFNEHLRKIKLFLHQGLIEEMASGHVDGSNWKTIIEAYSWFNEQRNSLPDDLVKMLEDMFYYLQTDLNGFLNFLRDVASKGKSNDILSKEKALEMLRNIQSKFTDSSIKLSNIINNNNPVENKSKKSFDIFISKKSSDYHIAKEIYDFLVNKGFSVFLSEESLPNIGGTEYMKEIDEALESSQHLIVIGSSLDNITSSWVEAEWRVFINEKRAGRKKGNVLTLITGSLLPKDLPLSLRYYEVMSINDKTKIKLSKYLKSIN